MLVCTVCNNHTDVKFSTVKSYGCEILDLVLGLETDGLFFIQSFLLLLADKDVPSFLHAFSDPPTPGYPHLHLKPKVSIPFASFQPLKCSFFASENRLAFAFVFSLSLWGRAVLFDFFGARGIVGGFIIASLLFRSSQP